MLGVLRGAMLDLLATGNLARTTESVMLLLEANQTHKRKRKAKSEQALNSGQAIKEADR